MLQNLTAMVSELLPKQTIIFFPVFTLADEISLCIFV